MVLEIVSICINSCLSLIAIIVSIIAIKNQTKEQKLQNTIQLFDKRLEIYTHLQDIFEHCGLMLKHFHFPYQINKITYEKFCFAMSKHHVSEGQIDMLVSFCDKGDLLKAKAIGLLDAELKEYVCTTIDLFAKYIDVIIRIHSFKKPIKRSDYLAFKKLYMHVKDEKKGRVIIEFYKYLDLTDIYRY